MNPNSVIGQMNVEIKGQKGCFPAGTMISTPNGLVPIELVQAGTEVHSFNPQTGKMIIGLVKKIWKHPRKDTHDKYVYIEYSHNLGTHRLYCTENHYIWNAEFKWTEAGDMQHTSMWLENGEPVAVDGVVHEDDQPDAFKVINCNYSYNLTVGPYHTFIANDVRVSNKGGDKGDPPHTPVEAPNTLRSKQIIRLIDLIGEGEIEGFAYPPFHSSKAGDTITDPVEFGQAVFIDDSPLQNEDLTFNFGGIIIKRRVGLPFPSQTSIPGFAETENTVVVNTPVTVSGGPVIGSPIDDQVDAARVVLTWTTIAETDVDLGDINGSGVVLAIDTRVNVGGFTEVRRETVKGKTTSLYNRAFRVERPSGLGPSDTWTVRVRRITADPTVVTVRNEFTWSNYVEITDTKHVYSDSAVIALELDSELIGGRVPIRSFEIKGIKIRVPSNYNPVTRNYTGIFDGTFTVAFSNNPAWVLFDLLTNDRYGLGIDELKVDKFKFFEIGQYCDAVDSSGTFVGVDDGFGGVEPRFTFNGIIQTRGEAFQVINTLSTVFLGMTYWSSGQVTLTQDSPADPVRIIGPSNVIDGIFEYSTTSVQARHTRVKVTWSDPDDQYRPRLEFIEDLDAVDRFGNNEVDIVAFGCTSRGQAHRFGRWILDSERFEGEIVSFRSSFEQSDLFPGSVIEIQDPHFSGFVLMGRVGSGSTLTNVVLDRTITLPSPGPYTLKYMRIEAVSITDADWVATASNSRFTNATVGDLTDSYQVGETIEVTGFTDAANLGFHEVTDVQATFVEVVSTLVDESPASSTLAGQVGILEGQETISGAFPQTANNFTVVNGFGVAAEPDAVWLIEGTAAGQKPTLWRIVSNAESEKGVYEFLAVLHDPAKYARIEDGIVTEPDARTRFDERAISSVCVSAFDSVQAVAATDRFVFSNQDPSALGFNVGDEIDVQGFLLGANEGVHIITAVGTTFIEVSASSLTDEGPITDITVKERLTLTVEVISDAFGVRPVIRVSFDEPAGVQRGFRMEHEFNNQPQILSEIVQTPELYIFNPQPGVYSVRVFAINAAGYESPACETSAEYTKADLFIVDSIKNIRVDGQDPAVTTFTGAGPLFTWDRISALGSQQAGITTTLVDTDVTAQTSGNSYVRTTGSWITDGFLSGQLIEITGGYSNAANLGKKVVTGVTTTSLNIQEILVTETPVGNSLYEVLEGRDSGQFEDYFRDFRVRLLDSGSVLLRQDFVKDPFFQVPFALNTILLGGPHRTIEIEVSLRDHVGRESVTTSETFTNPLPAIPTNIAVDKVGPDTYTLTYDECLDNDCTGGILVFHSKTSGFTPSLVTETKSVGSVEITTVLGGSTFQTDVDTIDVSGVVSPSTTTPSVAATAIKDAINAKISRPAYRAEINSGNSAQVDIFAAQEFGATPNGRVVVTVETGGGAATDTNFASGVDAILVGQGFHPLMITIDSQIEPNNQYFVRIAHLDEFWNAVEGVGVLNISPEIAITSLDSSQSAASLAPLQVVGVSLSQINTSINPDGTAYADIKIDWTALAIEPSGGYQIRIEDGIGEESFYTVPGDTSQYVLKNAQIGGTHLTKVRGFNSDGTTGPFSTQFNIVPSSDTTPPGVPTVLAATPTFQANWVTFRVPSAPDFARVEIFSSTSNDSSTSTHIGSVTAGIAGGGPNQEAAFYHGQLAPLSVHFYWFRSVDRSGNLSALTPSQFAGVTNSGVLQTKSADYENLSIVTAVIDDLAVNEAKIASLAVTTAKIGLLAVDTAQIANLSVETLKINGLAVTTPKIEDDATTSLAFTFTAGALAIGDGPTWTSLQTTSLTAVDGDPAVIDGFYLVNLALSLSGTNDYFIDFRMRIRNDSTSTDELTLTGNQFKGFGKNNGLDFVFGSLLFSFGSALQLTAGDNYTAHLEARKSVTGGGGGSFTTADAINRFVRLTEFHK